MILKMNETHRVKCFALKLTDGFKLFLSQSVKLHKKVGGYKKMDTKSIKF